VRFRAVIFFLLAGAAQAEPVGDPLDSPALLSPRGQHLMAARVAKAGGRLVSVGERGTILLSDDQGRSWRQVASPVRVTLTAVDFPTPRLGWAVGNGGVVLATQDGGESWSKRLDGDKLAALEVGQAEADLVSAPTDQQAQHRVREAKGLEQDGPDKPLMDVHFFDETHGLIVGTYGLAFRTEDGGKSWQSIMGRTDDPLGRHLYGIEAAPDGVYLAGEQGAIFKSNDGGKSFRHLANPGKGSFFGLVSAPSGAVIAYGLRGAVFRSEDGGVHWTKVNLTFASFTAGRRLADGSLLLVDEGGGVWRSTDAGKSFTAVPRPDGPGLSGVVEAAPGLLVISSDHGNFRVALASPSAEAPK
jgi:photosystem II stability/assembly factor-like uncharacterized protein